MATDVVEKKEMTRIGCTITKGKSPPATEKTKSMTATYTKNLEQLTHGHLFHVKIEHQKEPALGLWDGKSNTFTVLVEETGCYEVKTQVVTPSVSWSKGDQHIVASEDDMSDEIGRLSFLYKETKALHRRHTTT